MTGYGHLQPTSMTSLTGASLVANSAACAPTTARILAHDEGAHIKRSTDCKGPRLPIHNKCLFKLGLPLGELWYLEELTKWLSVNGRNRFFLTAPPLRLTGAVGSPVTPVATV